MTQMLEDLRQVPALQRGRLIKRVRLHFDQRQIVQRVGHERAQDVGGARMADDLLAAAQDHHGVATGEAMLVAQTLENPLGRGPLLDRRGPVSVQDRNDHRQQAPSLGFVTGAVRV